MNQTINISLPKTLNNLAKKQVKAGYFSSVSEVVRSALRQFLLSSNIPTYKMSAKAEKKAIKAYEEYKAGKAIEINSFQELENL